jgi:hypothetical protein
LPRTVGLKLTQPRLDFVNAVGLKKISRTHAVLLLAFEDDS